MNPLTTIDLAISPCPNDTLMFYALLNQKIETHHYAFSCDFMDIEQLNELSLKGSKDMIKLSAAQFVKQDHYELCLSGGAIGFGVGPLVIGKKAFSLEEIPSLRVALPGMNTTANMLFSLAFPEAKKKTFCLFSDIEEGLHQNRWDIGVIIHETRFSFHQKGFYQVFDLGDFWEKTYRVPLPLGVIGIKKTLPLAQKKQMNDMLKSSIMYGMKSWGEAWPYIQNYAQDLTEEICQKHCKLYVNDFSLDMGNQGLLAVEKFRKRNKGYL